MGVYRNFLLIEEVEKLFGKATASLMKKGAKHTCLVPKRKFSSKKAEEQHWVLKAYFTPLLCCPLTNTTHLTHIPVLFCIRKSFCTVNNKSLHT